MANVNMALDEIISSKKSTGGGGRRRNFTSRRGGAGGSRRGGGGFRREKYFSDDTPAGKWKHDKFGELYGGGSKKRGASGGSPVGIRRPRPGSKAAQIVKLNISNLPDSVVTADLEELFQEFGVCGVAVHYDESGQHLGTADLFVDNVSARDIIREYANIAIDGQEINIAYVDESGALKPRIQDRVRRVANNPIRRRKERHSSPPKRRGARGGKATGSAPKAKQMTVEELDKELEAYMGKKA